ncbi:MAG: hypothetical protein ACLFOY_17770 [Desulfatibacillaceae bacterium]
MGRRWWIAVAMVFLIAAGIRLVAVSAMAEPPGSDAAEYHALATGAAGDRAFATKRPPLYPLFLSAVAGAWHRIGNRRAAANEILEGTDHARG